MPIDLTKSTDIENRPKSIVSCSITWIDGRALFKDGLKWGNAYYGVCSYSRGVFAVTPLDWPRVKLLTSIKVSPTERYCEYAYSCLNFNCPLNRFDKYIFAEEFKDCGLFSLGLPNNISSKKPLWFSAHPWDKFFQKITIPVAGGRIEFNENEAKKILGE